jgi:hypothetical protein
MANTAINIVQRLDGPLVTAPVVLIISVTAPHFAPASPASFLPTFSLLIVAQLITLASASRLPKFIHRETLAKA